LANAKPPKGLRKPTPVSEIHPHDIHQMMEELKKRRDPPIQALLADVAVVEGIIDLLILKGIITDTEIRTYGDRYQSSISALIMLCVEKGVFTEADLNKAIVAFHHVIRTHQAGKEMTPDEVLSARQNYLRGLLETE